MRIKILTYIKVPTNNNRSWTSETIIKVYNTWGRSWNNLILVSFIPDSWSCLLFFLFSNVVCRSFLLHIDGNLWNNFQASWTINTKLTSVNFIQIRTCVLFSVLILQLFFICTFRIMDIVFTMSKFLIIRLDQITIQRKNFTNVQTNIMFQPESKENVW